MPIVLKSPAEIERMRAAGEVVAAVHRQLGAMIEPGIATRELDQAAYEIIAAAGGRPSFLGYRGYPASICASVNEVVLHGIPGDRILHEGDIISIDVGVELGGYHGDAAVTHGVGAISDPARALIDITESCFFHGLERLCVGSRLGDVAAAVQELAESHGYGVVREYTGHGVGRQMHEDPSVPNYGEPRTGTLVRRGMTIALEPMITAGSPATHVLQDGWTVLTADGSLAAHYEHTVAVTEDGPVLLTVSRDGVIQ